MVFEGLLRRGLEVEGFIGLRGWRIGKVSGNVRRLNIFLTRISDLFTPRTRCVGHIPTPGIRQGKLWRQDKSLQIVSHFVLNPWLLMLISPLRVQLHGIVLWAGCVICTVFRAGNVYVREQERGHGERETASWHFLFVRVFCSCGGSFSGIAGACCLTVKYSRHHSNLYV